MFPQIMLSSFVFLLFGLSYGNPPVIPIGLDAYRQWDKLPYQRIGARAYMRSTYDRAGGNEGVDASHFLYQESDSFNVTLDVAGKGVLYFSRYNFWHGSPWHYEVNGTDHIVQESSTATPNAPVPNSTFIPVNVFPNPLTWTSSVTKGADLMWVPIPFDSTFRMAYGRTCYGTGYYIYHLFADTSLLSQPLRPFDFSTPPDTAVLNLLKGAGTDIAPQPGTAGVTATGGSLNLGARDSQTVTILSTGPASVRALTFSAPKTLAVALGRVFIRITWDNRPYPSVEAPLNLFYGTGSFYNRSSAEYLVKALPVSVRFDATRITLACYFPMPFFRSAKLELVNRDTATFTGIQWNIRTQPYTDSLNRVGYFHATYKDHGIGVSGQDLVFLDTKIAEGGGDWSGSFVGTSFIFSTAGVLTTLEGDPRFFFDDSRSPQAYGTGTEEWGGGGNYWGGVDMTIPFAGHPVGAADWATTIPEDRINSAYRFLIADLMPFGRNARIQFEHGGTDAGTEHYSSVTYWYGLPGASLVPTDSIHLANLASEQAHAYNSPAASAPISLTSAWDGLGTNAATRTDSGRTTTGTSELIVSLRPDNYGVLLRRTLDYQYPNQRAAVYVADTGNQGNVQWKYAGIWYLAGSNTCIYSNPGGELDPAMHTVETSNRRFREDEFLISRQLTQGHFALRIRVQFAPINHQLYSGCPFPQATAWSEIEYKAYCYVMPSVKVGQLGIRNGSQGSGKWNQEIKLAAMPGPFKTGIRFLVSGISNGKIPLIDIFNSSGKVVARLVADNSPGFIAATYSWNTGGTPSGVYVARLQVEGQVQTKRIMLAK
jgi:hypothetical protein